MFQLLLEIMANRRKNNSRQTSSPNSKNIKQITKTHFSEKSAGMCRFLRRIYLITIYIRCKIGTSPHFSRVSFVPGSYHIRSKFALCSSL